MLNQCKELCRNFWKEEIEPSVVFANAKTCKEFCQTEKGQWFIGGVAFGIFYTVVAVAVLWAIAQ